MRILPAKFVKIIFLALPILSAGAAWPADGGKVEGVLHLGDENIPLTHVYAREVEQIPEMTMEGRPPRQLTVILADRAMPADMPSTSFAMSQLASAGNIRGVTVDLDPATGAILGGNVYLGPAYYSQFFSQSGTGSFPVEGFSFAGGQLKASLHSAEPQEILGSAEGGPATYSFNATVTAPVAPGPKLLETLEGDAARGSEPAISFAKFLNAVATGDVAGARAGIAAAHPGQEMMTAAGLPQVKMMLLAGYADAKAFLADLKKAYIYDTRAVLFFSAAGGNSSTSMAMAREDGAWKLGAE